MKELIKTVHTLNQQLSGVPIIVQLAQQIHLPPAPAVGAALIMALSAFLLVMNVGSGLICQWIGLLYPLFATYKIIDRKDPASGAAGKGCLTYWLVYGSLSLVDFIINGVLAVLPMYHVLRAGFQVWLIYKDFAGAQYMADVVVLKVFSHVNDFVTQIVSVPASGSSKPAK